MKKLKFLFVLFLGILLYSQPAKCDLLICEAINGCNLTLCDCQHIWITSKKCPDVHLYGEDGKEWTQRDKDHPDGEYECTNLDEIYTDPNQYRYHQTYTASDGRTFQLGTTGNGDLKITWENGTDCYLMNYKNLYPGQSLNITVTYDPITNHITVKICPTLPDVMSLADDPNCDSYIYDLNDCAQLSGGGGGTYPQTTTTGQKKVPTGSNSILVTYSQAINSIEMYSPNSQLGDVSVRIISSDGKIIAERCVNISSPLVLNLPNIQAGIYYYVLYDHATGLLKTGSFFRN